MGYKRRIFSYYKVLNDQFKVETTKLTTNHPPLFIDSEGGEGGAKGPMEHVHSFSIVTKCTEVHLTLRCALL